MFTDLIATATDDLVLFVLHPGVLQLRVMSKLRLNNFFLFISLLALSYPPIPSFRSGTIS